MEIWEALPLKMRGQKLWFIMTLEVAESLGCHNVE